MGSAEPLAFRIAALCVVLSMRALAARGEVTEESGLSEPADLERLLDGVVVPEMQRHDVPGTAFVLVKEGRIVFAKGWGYADLERRTPVLPDKTVFRVASSSKPFTATAVLQLVERGDLALDMDVNRYLRGFRLEPAFPRPVTLHHLLTHTAGLDERFLGGYASSPDDGEPLAAHLAAVMPARVMPPGEVMSYSNYGFALAGHLVESVTGESFVDYVQAHVLEPLDMRRTSLRQPPPPSLGADAAVSYTYRGGRYHRVPFVRIKAVPAGAMSATATDMAHFLVAQLEGGRYGERRVLEESTLALMHRAQCSAHPRMPGLTYGFAEYRRNGKTMLYGGGDLQGFTSMMILMPEERLAFFIVSNAPRPQLKLAVLKAFLDRYYPGPSLAPVRAGTGAQERASALAGSYRHNRYTRHEVGKIAALASELRVRASGWDLEAAGRLWVEVEPLLYRRVDADEFLTFRRSASGSITHVCFWNGVYERVPWYETARFHLAWVVACGVAFLSALLRPLFPLLRRQNDEPSRALRRGRAIATFTAAVNLVFMACVVVGLWAGQGQSLLTALPRWLNLALLLPWLSAALTLSLLALTARAWRNRAWPLGDCAHVSLVAISALAFLLFLHHWNLIGGPTRWQ